MIHNSITNLAITWDLFTWPNISFNIRSPNIRFDYFFVHRLIVIMHHALKLFDESLFRDLLSVASQFWEPHCILILRQYFVKKILYITECLLYVWFDLEVCFFSKLTIILRRYLLPNIISEKYDTFFVWTKSFTKLKSIYI